jgi:CHAD domain-containing protein
MPIPASTSPAKRRPARVKPISPALAQADLSPHGAEEPRLAPTDSAAKAFRLIAASAMAQVGANAAVLARARRPEALHQMRVGLRRLRGALSLFGPMLVDDSLAGLKSELKWITGELGPARDLDVFLNETYRPLLEPHRDWPDLVGLGHALREARTRAYDRAQAAVTSSRFGVLAHDITAWIAAGAWTTDAGPKQTALRARPIGRLAPELLTHARKTVVKRGRKLKALDPEARHKLRIHAKRLRYAAGFFGSLYSGDAPKPYKRFGKASHALTSALGDQTDVVAAAALAAEIAAASPPRVAYTAGLVAADRIGGEAKAMKDSLKALKAFREAEPFW